MKQNLINRQAQKAEIRRARSWNKQDMAMTANTVACTRTSKTRRRTPNSTAAPERENEKPQSNPEPGQEGSQRNGNPGAAQAKGARQKQTGERKHEKRMKPLRCEEQEIMNVQKPKPSPEQRTQERRSRSQRARKEEGERNGEAY